MLRLREHVQALHGLEQRRVAEGHGTVLLVAQLETDRDQQTFGIPNADVKRGSLQFPIQRIN